MENRWAIHREMSSEATVEWQKQRMPETTERGIVYGRKKHWMEG